MRQNAANYSKCLISNVPHLLNRLIFQNELKLYLLTDSICVMFAKIKSPKPPMIEIPEAILEVFCGASRLIVDLTDIGIHEPLNSLTLKGLQVVV